jgi:hypothetical protein
MVGQLDCGAALPQILRPQHWRTAMADPDAESKGQGFKRRRGWQPPTGSDSPPGAVPPRPSGSDPADAVKQEHRPPQGGRFSSVLPNSVAGQARNVGVGTRQGPGGSVAVVTFRLEQYDPNAGRTGLVTVRMVGNQAMGFATEGDWVEVNGKSKSGFLDAKTAVNHTSGAQYRGPSDYARVLVITFVVFVAVFILFVAVMTFGAIFRQF